MDLPGLRAVVFDVDGTLVDSERDGHRVAFNQAFEEFGLPDRWDEELYGDLLEVTGGERRIRHYLLERRSPEFGKLSAEEAARLASDLHRRKTEIFATVARSPQLDARPGVRRLLAELVESGIAVGVATTGSPEWVYPLVDRLFGLQHFAAVVTAAEAPRRKPDPSAYHVALAQLGVAAEEAVAVEDSGPGVEAAEAAGLVCAVVTNGYTRLDTVIRAPLVLDGFGHAGRPARVIVDRYAICPSGVLDAACLARLLAAHRQTAGSAAALSEGFRARPGG